MASIYKLEPETLFTVPDDDRVTECKLCYEVARPDDGIDLGPLYQYGRLVRDKPDTVKTNSPTTEMEVYCAHYFCLLFSSGLFQGGNEDDMGIKGFLPQDILKEWRRGVRLKCFRCNKKYATIGCAAGRSCRRSYHLPCAIRDQALMQFCEEFRLYCSDHRLRQAIYYSTQFQEIQDERECGICSDDLPKCSEQTHEEQMNNIWSPCCNKWFHKDCIQQFAKNSGYFFKCPLCNNKDVFEKEMKSFGVYVPEQDATWETQDNGALFEGLLERHNRCDAEDCVCPDGREADEDYTIWEIILCWLCGAQGVHVKCGDLPLTTDTVKWKCKDCLETLKKMPKRTIHNFRKIQRNKKSTNRASMNTALSDTSIIVGNSNTATTNNDATKVTFNVDYRGFCASFNLCPKYDVPMPVKISNVPWQDKDPSVLQLEAAARDSSATVKLERMELTDQQYSVYTIWSPARRERNVPTKSSINISSNDPSQTDLLNTPRRPLIQEENTSIKSRSPSVPKSKPLERAQVNPRSQSVPPNFPESGDLKSQQREIFQPGKIAFSTQAPHSPMKAKFKEKIKQKEVLVAAKKIACTTLGKSSRITQEMKDITGKKHHERIDRTTSRKSNKGKFSGVRERWVQNTEDRTISEKRKSAINDANESSPVKRLKYEGCLHSPEQTLQVSKCEIISAESDEHANISICSPTEDFGSKEPNMEPNLQNSERENQINTGIDLSKTQTSILKYFNFK